VRVGISSIRKISTEVFALATPKALSIRVGDSNYRFSSLATFLCEAVWSLCLSTDAEDVTPVPVLALNRNTRASICWVDPESQPAGRWDVICPNTPLRHVRDQDG
jgi:hypothetical protein